MSAVALYINVITSFRASAMMNSVHNALLGEYIKYSLTDNRNEKQLIIKLIQLFNRTGIRRKLSRSD